jgi:purine-binding chemotaxis protein CheW
MDISKLRKKHKEAKEKPEPKEPEERPEEPSEPEETEGTEGTEEEFVEEPEVAEDTEEEFAEEEAVAAALEEKAAEAEAVPPKSKEPMPEAPSEPEEEGAEGELVELVTFTLADEYYAFRVTEVHEVLRPQYIANVPRAADFIIGVTSLRGKIIPVMDLRQRLNIGGEAKKAANIVILKGVGKGIIGVLVDRTLDVIKVSESEIKQPPSHLVSSEARFIEGVTSQEEKFISVILPDELLAFDSSLEER